VLVDQTLALSSSPFLFIIYLLPFLYFLGCSLRLASVFPSLSVPLNADDVTSIDRLWGVGSALIAVAEGVLYATTGRWDH
jgi:hypothetical protein